MMSNRHDNSVIVSNPDPTGSVCDLIPNGIRSLSAELSVTDQNDYKLSSLIQIEWHSPTRSHTFKLVRINEINMSSKFIELIE